MENLIKQFNTIDTSFKKMKFITVLTVCVSAIVTLGAVFMATRSIEAGRSQIYVLDKGSAILAHRSGEDTYRDLEAQDHVTRFHELMFNITPNSESIKRNLERALVMSDKSAYDYYMDMSERGFYQRVVSANISQEIVLDSVKVDMSSYPYETKAFGKLFLLRESNITAYEFESSCRLVDVDRSPSNPHGLLVEKFAVTRNDKIGTRRRN